MYCSNKMSHILEQNNSKYETLSICKTVVRKKWKPKSDETNENSQKHKA